MTNVKRLSLLKSWARALAGIVLVLPLAAAAAAAAAEEEAAAPPAPPADIVGRGASIEIPRRTSGIAAIDTGRFGGAGMAAGGQMLEFQRRSIRNQQQMYEARPVAQTCRPGELIKFSMIDGLLGVEFGPEPDPERGEVRVAVEGSPATWLVRAQAASAANSSISVARLDFDQTADGLIWSTSIARGDGYLSMSAEGIGLRLQYNQSRGMAQLVLWEVQRGRNVLALRLEGPSFLHLQAEHPQEVHQYLMPLLVRLGGEHMLRPGGADVYRVFSELPAPAAMAAKVRELLPRLDSAVFSERDAASRELSELGARGAQVVLKLERSLLTFEQNDRLDAFLDTQRRRAIDGDPASMRKDTAFLVDCLEDEDPAVRGAAKEALEKALGRRVEFVVNADRGKRAAGAEELREEMRKAKAAAAAGAATQPS
jgi:hypothetical protein